MWSQRALKDMGEVRQIIVRLKEVGFSSELVTTLESASVNIEKNYFKLVQTGKQKDITETAADEVIASASQNYRR
jgi:hypothetical protein